MFGRIKILDWKCIIKTFTGVDYDKSFFYDTIMMESGEIVGTEDSPYIRRQLSISWIKNGLFAYRQNLNQHKKTRLLVPFLKS